MLPCEADELVHIGSDGLHAALHGRYAVAPSLKAGALTPDGPELLVCDAGRPASVHSAQIAAEHKHLAWPQLPDILRRISPLCHSHVLYSL